ncbi:MAG: Cyclic di-GMP phosphodiesterase response regulator RpfG [Syntrophomonadaceae bacterium]|nr:Cyclic di-GMP phosphodiesterase response regulator RpfG [Bacillota bacterium]
MLRTITETLKLKSIMLFTHSVSVAKISCEVYEKLYYSRGNIKENLEMLMIAGILHDVGKLSVPDDVMNKKEKPTHREMELIKLHPVISCEFFKDLFKPHHLLSEEKVNKIYSLIRGHHELPNGDGYPDGLYANDMSPELKLMCIVDKVCALSEERPYRSMVYPVESIMKSVVCDMAWKLNESEIKIIIDFFNHKFTKNSSNILNSPVPIL